MKLDSLWSLNTEKQNISSGKLRALLTSYFICPCFKTKLAFKVREVDLYILIWKSIHDILASGEKQVSGQIDDMILFFKKRKKSYIK